MRYPFLYPRNRWTGKHWQSWKLDKYLYGNRGLWPCPKPEDTEGIWDKAFQNYYDEEGHIHTITKSYLWTIWYYIVYFIAEYVLPIFHCIPTYTEWDAMDGMPGWKKAFGKQYLKELKKQLKKDHYLYQFRITDIKEKYGTLRLYCNGASDEVYKIVDKYETLSYETCIECGKPATKIKAGWISPYCDECFPKNAVVYMKKWKNGKWHETREYKRKTTNC